MTTAANPYRSPESIDEPTSGWTNDGGLIVTGKQVELPKICCVTGMTDDLSLYVRRVSVRSARSGYVGLVFLAAAIISGVVLPGLGFVIDHRLPMVLGWVWLAAIIVPTRKVRVAIFESPDATQARKRRSRRNLTIAGVFAIAALTVLLISGMPAALYATVSVAAIGSVAALLANRGEVRLAAESMGKQTVKLTGFSDEFLATVNRLELTDEFPGAH